MKVSEIVTDWVSRTLCPAWHCPMGMAQSVNDSVNWFRQGLEWVDMAGKPGQSNRHAKALSHARLSIGVSLATTCVCTESCSMSCSIVMLDVMNDVMLRRGRLPC